MIAEHREQAEGKWSPPLILVTRTQHSTFYLNLSSSGEEEKQTVHVIHVRVRHAAAWFLVVLLHRPT